MRTTRSTTIRTRVAIPLLFALAFALIGFAAGKVSETAREGTKEIAAEGLGTIAWRARYAPGEIAPMHEHAKPRFVVVLAGGTLRATAPDGTERDIALETGAVSIRPAEWHALRNVGTTTVEVVEIEMP